MHAENYLIILSIFIVLDAFSVGNASNKSKNSAKYNKPKNSLIYTNFSEYPSHKWQLTFSQAKQTLKADNPKDQNVLLKFDNSNVNITIGHNISHRDKLLLSNTNVLFPTSQTVIKQASNYFTLPDTHERKYNALHAIDSLDNRIKRSSSTRKIEINISVENAKSLPNAWFHNKTTESSQKGLLNVTQAVSKTNDNIKSSESTTESLNGTILSDRLPELSDILKENRKTKGVDQPIENKQTTPIDDNEKIFIKILANKVNDNYTLDISREQGSILQSESKLSYIMTRNDSLVDITKNQIVVRKCCPSLQYFNSKSASCIVFNEVNKFDENIFHILSKKSSNVAFISESLQCPDPAIVSTYFGVSNITYAILSDGQVFDISSNISYNQSQYCLELVGDDLSKISFTLAYCQNVTDTYDYYSYDYEEILPGDQLIQTENINERVLIVRKCCLPNEYYNSLVHKCTPTGALNSVKFDKKVIDLSFASNVTVNVTSSRLQNCPDGRSLPSVHQINSQTYRLRHNGDLIELDTGRSYNYSFYCLEETGSVPDNVSLIIALCHTEEYIIPKCCPLGNYFDEDELDCLPIPQFGSHEKILLNNYNFDNNTYTTQPLNYFLSCPNALPAKALSVNMFLKNGALCVDNECYSKEEYCIEYVGDSNVNDLQAIAYYCRHDYFVKCCNLGEALGDYGCMIQSDDNSQYLKRALRTRSIVRSFNYKECKEERALLLEESFAQYVHWWIGGDGSSIVVQSDTEVREISHYCIDDFKSNNGRVQPVVYVCESDVENMIPVEKTHKYKRPGSIGKCCPESFEENAIYFYSPVYGECQVTITNSSLDFIDHFNGSNLTSVHFHDFPKCSTGSIGYHSYPVNPSFIEFGDYAALTSEADLKIITLAGNCIENQKVITDKDFCFEYLQMEDGRFEPSAFICAHDDIVEIYDERFGLVTALLAISCVCLCITLVSLFKTRVRRGIVSIRKVNTLAGRILVSFVASHLIGFVALSLTQYENSLNKAKTPGCFVLAGLIQFFNLATFCWNTSICLESLLLTIHIRISKWTRYFLHSIWAWGFPTIMTVLMFAMDANRDKLSCGAVLPNIGVHHCFIFGTTAKLVYFYLPIFITLSANIIFLVGAKTLRTSRLKRLEKGKPRGASLNIGKAFQNDKSTAHTSGMRIHQRLNAKAESIRLVLWTGGSWFLELAGFVMSRYILPPEQEAWYYYLWYIPTSLNALRGVGIFAIIVLTPDTRSRGSHAMTRLKRSVEDTMRTLRNNDSTLAKSRNASRDQKRRDRSMSIITMISSIRNSSMNGNIKSFMTSVLSDQTAEECVNGKVGTYRKSNHIPNKLSSSSSLPAEECEMKENIHRGKSLSYIHANTLPELPEEHIAIIHENES